MVIRLLSFILDKLRNQISLIIIYLITGVYVYTYYNYILYKIGHAISIII